MKRLLQILILVLVLVLDCFAQGNPNPPLSASQYGRALIRKPSIQAMRDYLSITNGGGGGLSSNEVYQIVVTYGGGTNGGGVYSNTTATLTVGTWATNTTAYSVWVIQSVILTGGAAMNAQARLDVDSDLDGTADWDRRVVLNVAAAGDNFIDIKEISALIPPGDAWRIFDDSISGTVTIDEPAQLVYFGGSGGSGSAFDGNITNGTARGYLQFVDGVTIGAKITPTNSFFDTGNNLAVGTNNASGAALNVEGTARFSSVQLRDQQHYSKIGSGTHLLLKPELHNGIESIYYWGGATLNAQAWTVGSYEEGLTNGRFSFLVGELGISWNIGRSTNAAGDVGYLAATPSTNVVAFMSGASGPELRAAVSYRRDDDRNLFGGSSRGTTITGTNVIISVGTSTVTLSSNGITSTVPFPANQAAIGAVQYNSGGDLGASSSIAVEGDGILNLGETGVSGVLKLYDVTYDDWSVLSGDSGVIEVTAATPAVLKADGGFKIASVTITSGSGSPESVVTAPVGSLFLRTDGSTSTTLYVKTSGAGNTGWTAK